MYFPDRGCVRPLRHLYGYAAAPTARKARGCGWFTPAMPAYRAWMILLVSPTCPVVADFAGHHHINCLFHRSGSQLSVDAHFQSLQHRSSATHCHLTSNHPRLCPSSVNVLKQFFFVSLVLWLHCAFVDYVIVLLYCSHVKFLWLTSTSEMELGHILWPSDPGIQRPGDPVDSVTMFYSELQMSTYVWRKYSQAKEFLIIIGKVKVHCMDWHPVIPVQQQTPDNDFCHFSISNVRFAFWAFLENRKTRVSYRVKTMTRWTGRERWPKWPIDPVTQWPSSMSAWRRDEDVVSSLVWTRRTICERDGTRWSSCERVRTGLHV